MLCYPHVGPDDDAGWQSPKQPNPQVGYQSVPSCLLLLVHLLKVGVNRNHTRTQMQKTIMYIFFSLLVTERMNQTTDVKAPEPKSPEQTNPAVDMRLQCSARLNCCFFSMESGEKSISVWTLPIMLSNTYSNNLTIYFANSKNLLYAFVIQTPRFV